MDGFKKSAQELTLPAWVRFVTMDKDGEIRAWENRPFISMDGRDRWVGYGSRIYVRVHHWGSIPDNWQDYIVELVRDGASRE